MGSVQIRIDPTPNPNSLKVTLDRTLMAGKPATFDTPEAAAGNPLARSLLGIGGIRSVFMLGNFFTVTKAPEADWTSIEPGIEAAVKAAYES